MSYPVFYVPAGDVLPILFSTYDGGTGASLTMSGLAVTDIEIYKDGGTTQRASDAGYTLLDTDGIDFDSLTGIHGFSIDTGDNTDAGFYTVGAWFHVVVSAITVDSQTVSFVAAAFRLMPAESVAGKPKVDVDAWLGTAAATPTVAGVPEVDVTHFGGSAGTFASGRPEANVNSIANNAITAAAVANGAIDAATFAADVDAEILSYLVDDATRIDASALNTASGTSIPAILVDTGTTLQAELDGIQADTEDIQSKIGTPGDFGSGASTLAANLQDMADNGTAAFDRSTDSLQAIRDRGDAAWTTATGFSTHSADDVWASATRTLTAIDEDSTTLDINAAVSAAVLAAVVEGTRTLQQSLRLLNAALGGKASGLETTTAVYRDIDDSKDRITATVDADGNRSAVTLDLT